MTNKLDILQSLYNATISTTETYRITITDSKKIYIKEKELTILTLCQAASFFKETI